MIVGIVVEYSIVLVDFANHELESGKSPREAVVEAARVRLKTDPDDLVDNLVGHVANGPWTWGPVARPTCR